MGQILKSYESKSKPGKKYEIVLGEDGVTYCTCWQWKRTRSCKHLQDYQINPQQKPEPSPPEDDLQRIIQKAVTLIKG